MAFIVILPSQVDAKSPVDDTLMQTIKTDLDDLDARFLAVKTFDYEFKINGPIANLPAGTYRKRLDGGPVMAAQTFTRARLFLEVPGVSGDLEVDVRKYKTPNTVITALTRQYSAAISSITQIAPALATQSISRFVTQVATQSISRWKASINISSIILLGGNLVRINLASAVDTDWLITDSITIAGATAGANNVTANIVRINDDGGNNIVITNASGVAQTGAVGTISLNAWAYNYVNPVDTNGFVAGESAIFASHTTAANNGTFAIYAVNSGGNNLIVKNSAGVAQAGVAGTLDTARWKYVYSIAVVNDFVVGEKARMASHSTAANNGDFTIVALNSGGNNIVVYNTAGVAQGGVAGTANTTRWIYALPTDPTASFSVGQNFVATGATTAANNGTFPVKQINRGAVNNLVISNVNGVTQVGAVGTLVHSRMLISFSSDQSAVYTIAAAAPSRINVTGTVSSANTGEFTVLEINRGGGANYNVVVDNAAGVEQASPAGRINFESRSIFVNRPKLSLPTSTYNSTNRDMQYNVRTAGGGDFNAEATVAANTILMMEFVSIPSGAPSDVTIQLV